MRLVAGVVVLLGLLFVAPYNGMVTKRADTDRSFADLDVQLQRRNDLIPNLVNAVKGALNQEQAVFGELAKARQAYAGAKSVEDHFLVIAHGSPSEVAKARDLLQPTNHQRIDHHRPRLQTQTRQATNTEI